MAETEKGGGEKRVRERDSVWVKEGNLISVLIKPNLFWRVTETARCHYADVHGWGEERGSEVAGENKKLNYK